MSKSCPYAEWYVQPFMSAWNWKEAGFKQDD